MNQRIRHPDERRIDLDESNEKGGIAAEKNENTMSGSESLIQTGKRLS